VNLQLEWGVLGFLMVQYVSYMVLQACTGLRERFVALKAEFHTFSRQPQSVISEELLMTFFTFIRSELFWILLISFYSFSL